MKTIKIYIAKFFGCWVGLPIVVLLFVLSGCVHEDGLSSDSDILSDENKIIMNLHLDLSQEQKEAIETRAVGIEDKEVRDIFVFLFDESSSFRAVEQSIERKPGAAAGSTRFFVAFDKNSLEDVDKFKVGDLVKVRDDLQVGKFYGPLLMLDSMAKLRGMKSIIASADPTYQNPKDRKSVV